jgi:hypothetical protein
MEPEDEGREAARKRVAFGSCPYTYKNSGVNDMDKYIATGNAIRRDQWFEGWSDEHERIAANDRVEGRDAALSRRVPSHDGLCGNGNYNERTDK